MHLERKIREAVKKDGTKCLIRSQAGSDYCFFHDPAKAKARRDAQAAGGRRGTVKTLDETTPDVKLESAGDLSSLLVDTINQVRKGQIDPRVANAIACLANILSETLDLDKIQKRLEQLEATRPRQDRPM